MSSILTERGWLSLKSAAIYTDLTSKSIQNAIDLGHLPVRHVSIKGSRSFPRIKREWLDAWIEGTPAKSEATP